MPVTEVVFRTVHGSHLYGMAGPHSDVDIYTVTTSRNRARQTVARHSDGTVSDAVTIGFDTFLEYAFSGSHQSVEALFSPYKEWGDGMEECYGAMLDGMRVTGGDVLAKYGRTIASFSHADDFKRRRHACRLWLNMQKLRWDGRFNPRMTTDEILWATELATSDIGGDELNLLLWEGAGALGDVLHN